uniref:Uncharacterized protein n=1 Tax=Arundo donax TaxID=35708 RepID=A0A0A9HWK7_ARUDO
MDGQEHKDERGQGTEVQYSTGVQVRKDQG